MKRSLAHTVWECKYYMVWVPKNGRKVIHGKLKKRYRAAFEKTLRIHGDIGS